MLYLKGTELYLASLSFTLTALRVSLPLQCAEPPDCVAAVRVHLWGAAGGGAGAAAAAAAQRQRLPAGAGVCLGRLWGVGGLELGRGGCEKCCWRGERGGEEVATGSAPGLALSLFLDWACEEGQ